MKWTNKKCENFNIYNVKLKKNEERKTPGDIIILQLCTNDLDDMIYSSGDIECDRLGLKNINHVLPFYPLKPIKTQNFEKSENIAGDIIVQNMCTKNHNHMRYSS